MVLGERAENAQSTKEERQTRQKSFDEAFCPKKGVKLASLFWCPLIAPAIVIYIYLLNLNYKKESELFLKLDILNQQSLIVESLYQNLGAAQEKILANSTLTPEFEIWAPEEALSYVLSDTLGLLTNVSDSSLRLQNKALTDGMQQLLYGNTCEFAKTNAEANSELQIAAICQDLILSSGANTIITFIESVKRREIGRAHV